MRNGDSYKIKHLSQSGTSVKDICQMFRNKYDAAEVKQFISVSDSDTPPPPKKKARKRLVAEG